MRKPLQVVCLAGTGLVAVAAFMVAAEQTPNSESPVRVALQKTLAPKSNDKARGEAPADSGWIGVMFEADQGHGVKVKEVFPGGPAAFAGLRQGDVLVKIDKTAVNSTDAVVAAIEKHSPKQQASLTVQRGKRTLELIVPVESLAEFNARYAREMMSRDPRDPKFGEHHGVSQADMNVELVRRLFEQNQRQEMLLHQLRDEVQALRTEVRGKSK